MPKTEKLVNAKSERYAPTLSKEVTDMVRMYCKINDINMQTFCEETIKKEVEAKFNRLKEADSEQIGLF